MGELLPDRLPWFVAGAVLGLLVVGLYAVANRPLGASGSYVEALAAVRRRRSAESWRVWYFAGLPLGGLLASLLRSEFSLRWGYEHVTDGVPPAVVALTVLGGAFVLGYGARMAGGCTSGHGICGTAARSSASWAVTASFMATAIAATLAFSALSGVLR